MTLQEIIDKVMAALEAAEAESPEPPIAAILDQALIQVALETARAAIVKRKQPNDFGAFDPVRAIYRDGNSVRTELSVKDRCDGYNEAISDVRAGLKDFLGRYYDNL